MVEFIIIYDILVLSNGISLLGTHQDSIVVVQENVALLARVRFPVLTRSISSDGQSVRLMSERSQVQTLH